MKTSYIKYVIVLTLTTLFAAACGSAGLDFSASAQINPGDTAQARQNQDNPNLSSSTQDAEIEINGFVQSVQDGSTVVNNETINIQSFQEANALLQAGVMVKIRVRVQPDGSLKAVSIDIGSSHWETGDDIQNLPVDNFY
jgi:hypothetical protein